MESPNVSIDHDDDNSNDGLQIVLESPRPRRRAKKELNDSEKEIIASVEKDIDATLEEKAAKTNLTTNNVKSILKHVVTSEEVLGLLKAAENPDENDEPVTNYEPKLTRAKTKELSVVVPVPVLPWVAPPKKKPSEVEKLFTEELQEDSSGDEYVPNQRMAREERKKKKAVEEQRKASEKKAEEEANIALRTRSKLSLSHTPLEALEESFIPPDITTDMYDMDCDDDVWRDFLKTFTRPLDEVTKAPEDEEHDPEYNILADDEIDKVDKEELRADRAVTISKKEVNSLIAELFEYADIYETNRMNQNQRPSAPQTPQIDPEPGPEPTVQKAELINLDNDPNVLVKSHQIPILQQQMRQHVQMLTQNFLLTYENPEFEDMAPTFKEFLVSFKSASLGKVDSMFHTVNLDGALKLIDEWEKFLSTESEESRAVKEYVKKVIVESINAKLAGNFYVPTFPPKLMDTIADSNVFIYPNLLPRIPFKPNSVTRSRYYYFTESESQLIASFLDQCVPQMKQDPCNLNSSKKLILNRIFECVQKYLVPHVSVQKVHDYMQKQMYGAKDNPIKYYFKNKVAPPTVHYVTPLEYPIIPPRKRSFSVLPHQWKQHIYPGVKQEVNNICFTPVVTSPPIILAPLTPIAPFCSPPVVQVNYGKKLSYRKGRSRKEALTALKRRRILPKKPCSRILEICMRNSNITLEDMLPDMPSLTPVKNQNEQSTSNADSIEHDKCMTNEPEVRRQLNFQNITSYDGKFYKPEISMPIRRNFEGVGSSNSGDLVSSPTTEKDNLDDINELMIASSTVKNKKEPSGAEKKRAKVRKEFLANLQMATPGTPEAEAEKEENFAERYYEKLRDSLEEDDFIKLIHILGNYDEKSGKFVDLYQNVQSVLLPKYKELSDEFLLFLTDFQAHMIGQLMPYYAMKDMARFTKKLQIYFKDQPTQLRKIIKAITDLAENPEVTLETVKSTVLPLLKGNAVLTDWFLQIFPTERPPRILNTGAYEVLDIQKELAKSPDEEVYETITVPDTEDPFGGPTCICECHNDDNPQFQNRSLHCTKCGLKFINGKIFLHTGKAPRPAVVSFITNPEIDHTKRLSATQRKRSDMSPSKQVGSPVKDSLANEEAKNNCIESEEDGDGVTKKTRRRAPKSRSKTKELKVCDKNKNDKSSSPPKPPKTIAKKRPRKKTVSKKSQASEDESGKETKPGSTAGQQKRLADDLDAEFGGGSAELVELKVSSDHSGESESEYFESPQDVTNTESEDSSHPSNISPTHQVTSWSREEDKIILQCFKQGSDSNEIFKNISKTLQNRSETEIKNRFHKLMSLLQEMTSKSSS